jgi:hypothetical protein
MKPEEILAVDQALDRLARLEARQASVVELRYFGGISIEETADIASLEASIFASPAAARRWWGVSEQPGSGPGHRTSSGNHSDDLCLLFR